MFYLFPVFKSFLFIISIYFWQTFVVPPKISPFSSGNAEAVHLGQYITYQCTITEGDLPLNILWTFNKQPLINEDNEDIIISKLGRRSSVLTIESVNAKNAGNYTCQGSNKAGKASFTTQLRVIGIFYTK